MMAHSERTTPAPLRRVRADDWDPMGGPVLPGEFRPLAPTPASSERSNGPTLPEKELLRQLVMHYRWVHLGADRLMRYNPTGRILEMSCEGVIHGDQDA